jgi:hypothetical protein
MTTYHKNAVISNLEVARVPPQTRCPCKIIEHIVGLLTGGYGMIYSMQLNLPDRHASYLIDDF